MDNVTLITQRRIYMEWKDIKGYEGYYQINELGKVKRVDSGKILKNAVGKIGYPVVSLWKNNKGQTKYIHRMLAECFLSNHDNKREVNHIDGVKTNNNLSNLEWVTPKENIKHAYDKGLNYFSKEGRGRISKSTSGRNVSNPPRRKKVLMYNEKGEFLKEYESATQAAFDTGISFSTVCGICRGSKSSKKWFFKYKGEMNNGDDKRVNE